MIRVADVMEQIAYYIFQGPAQVFIGFCRILNRLLQDHTCKQDLIRILG